jgi:hypothetical protein
MVASIEVVGSIVSCCKDRRNLPRNYDNRQILFNRSTDTVRCEKDRYILREIGNFITSYRKIETIVKWHNRKIEVLLYMTYVPVLSYF